MKYRWNIAPAQAALAQHLSSELNISPLVAQCLLNRGHSEPELIRRFIEPRLRDLADPFLLPNIARAVELLYHTRELGEALVIFGDYDVDGVTSTSILLEVFRALGWNAHAYLPSRMDEGYGLSRDGVENCLTRFPTKLLLAVDCGSTAVESIEWLKAKGVETVVLDHHQVSDPAPEPGALVNPQLGKDFHELCSAGLAFNLAHALVKKGRELNDARANDFDLKPLLDLVALGTIADLVPLTGENRILVSRGLERLTNTTRPGLVALMELAQCGDRIGVYQVGFQIGPRLNAAGRLESAEEALHLLMAESESEALPIAQSLDSRNRERQEIERGIAEQVVGAVKARFNPERDYVIVEGQMRWHIGVVGIVASRVLREFYRPSIILGGDGNEWRGSGRSIEGFDLAAALRECDDLLERHGGHPMAAGLSIRPENIDPLRERLNDIARKSLTLEKLKPPLNLDAEIPLESINMELLEQLATLEPFGQANSPVQVAIRGVNVIGRPRILGKGKNHLKLRVGSGATEMDALWWNAADQKIPDGSLDIAAVVEINDFRGRRSPQLKVLDIRASA